MTLLDAVQERLGTELLRRVAGPDADRRREVVHGAQGPRWFEADSPIGWVHGDASMFIGGIRAIMLQSLHPAAMQGVADHSGYRGDMWGRLAKISYYIATTTFGTERHAEQVIDAVRHVHESVTGTMPDGTAYAANDPHLLGWVHAAEIDSFLTAPRAFGARRLTRAQQDEYVGQTARVARRIGVLDPPTTLEELKGTLAAYGPELRGTDAARDAIGFLVKHPDLPWAARPAYWSLMGGAITLLPPWVRTELALPAWPGVVDAPVRAVGSLSTTTVRWAMAPGHARARSMRPA